jgi:hypothetical protein
MEAIPSRNTVGEKNFFGKYLQIQQWLSTAKDDLCVRIP